MRIRFVKVKFLILAVFSSGLLFLQGCGQSDFGEENPVVRVGNRYLFPKDLRQVGSERPSLDDSTSKHATTTFVNHWVSRQIFLKKALSTLSIAEKNKIESKASDYKEELMVYAYKRQVFRSRFQDTLVTETELQKVYHENMQRFKLREDLIKGGYVLLESNSKMRRKVKTLLRGISDVTVENELKTVCRTHAQSFKLFPNKWMTFAALRSFVPAFNQQKMSRFSEGRVYDFKGDDDGRVLMYFAKIQPQGSPAPMEYVEKGLKTIVINQRKIEFLRELKSSLYKESIRDKSYEDFTKG